MGLLLAFLKMLGTAAAKGAVGLGKAALTGAKAGAEIVGKGATEASKWAWNRMSQGAGLNQPESNALVKAFGSMITPNAEAATTERYPMDEKTPFGTTPGMPNVDLGRIRVPGPNGTFIEGQGEAMPGYGMQPGSTRIPPAYLQMAQAGQQPQLPQQAGQSPDVGAIRGFIDALTGQPQPGGLSAARQGRKTAYYAGGLIPKIVMSKLGQPSPAEETSRQQQIETSKTKKATPEYKKDLQEATIRLSNPNLSEADKIMIYQQLVTVYPERSAEIKRIIFPQSSDNFSDLLQGIIAGYGGGVNAR